MAFRETPELVGDGSFGMMSQTNKQRMTILVIDDEQSIREIVYTILKHAGYHVWLAATTYEALALLNQSANEIDLVLSDIWLPDSAGCELPKKLALIRPDIPIIWMTGDPHSINLSPGQDILEKPFLIKELLDKVHRKIRGDYRKSTS
jgi:DNA-binding NtrC family response regulator